LFKPNYNCKAKRSIRNFFNSMQGDPGEDMEQQLNSTAAERPQQQTVTTIEDIFITGHPRPPKTKAST
jgi:hypothetical protein